MKNIKTIHMIGVCGVAMGTLAGMLSQKGYRVRGSDENVYPPMSDMLARWGIDIIQGFDESNIGDADLVIVGNAVSRGNGEVEHMLNSKIPYMSMAQALHAFFLSEKTVIVVSGTHGKTTTTALLGFILDRAGFDPSFLTGGIPVNYGSNFRLGSGDLFVIEGDEYDSAYFEKYPKFIHYRPDHLIMTSLEFDHADIYASFDEIKLWFRRLVNQVPSRGEILYCSDYPVLGEVVSASLSSVHGYGREGRDIAYRSRGMREERTGLEITSNLFDRMEMSTLLIGDFNLANITAAASMAILLGAEAGSVSASVSEFRGIKRRQELLYRSEKTVLYEDFAHHPTSIRAVLGEMKQCYVGWEIWAVYEPRSATSRRRVLQEELCESFNAADLVFIKEPFKLDGIAESERIDINLVVDRINAGGEKARLFPSADAIVERISKEAGRGVRRVIVVMSNGGFDGIYGKLTALFGEREG